MLKGRLFGLFALVVARLREFRREPSAFFFVLFVPILWMAFLGPAFNNPDVAPLRDGVKAGTRYQDFLIPGLLAVSIFSTSLFGVGMTIVAHRREGLLKRYLATPMPSYDYILSHIIARIVILGIEVGTQLLAAFLLFRFRLAGSFWDYALFSLLGAAALTAMGILLASRLSNTGAMNGLANLLGLPMMVLSGAWFSRTRLPTWLSGTVDYWPLTPLVDGLRAIALDGAKLTDLTAQMGILGAYFVLFSLLAARFFKWF